MITTSQDHVTRIYGHDVSWWVRDQNLQEQIAELDEASEEHIASLLKEDYREGELAIYVPETEQTHYGWWKLN